VRIAFERGEQKAAGPARGIADGLPDARLHHLDHRLNQRPRREVLAGAALHLLGVAFEQAFVDRPLHIDAEAEPLLPVDQGNEALQLRRVADLVLRTLENQADQALGLRQSL
jgi:hypothetical protein